MNAPPKLPSGIGAPLGGTMTSRQELADGGPHGSPPLRDAASRKGSRRRACGWTSDGCQKRGPVPSKTPRRRAGRRPCSFTGARHYQDTSRRSARRPLVFWRGKGKWGVPGARQKTRAMTLVLALVLARTGQARRALLWLSSFRGAVVRPRTRNPETNAVRAAGFRVRVLRTRPGMTAHRGPRPGMTKKAAV